MDEIEGALIFAPGAPQIQTTDSNGQVSWNYTVSPSVEPGNLLPGRVDGLARQIFQLELEICHHFEMRWQQALHQKEANSSIKSIISLESLAQAQQTWALQHLLLSKPRHGSRFRYHLQSLYS